MEIQWSGEGEREREREKEGKRENEKSERKNNTSISSWQSHKISRQIPSLVTNVCQHQSNRLPWWWWRYEHSGDKCIRPEIFVYDCIIHLHINPFHLTTSFCLILIVMENLRMKNSSDEDDSSYMRSSSSSPSKRLSFQTTVSVSLLLLMTIIES